MKRLKKTFVAFLAVNLLVLLPMFWLITSYIPDRIDILVRTPVPLSLNIVAANAGSDVVTLGGTYRFGKTEVQEYRIWLSGGSTLSSIGMELNADPAHIEVLSVVSIKRLGIRRTLDLSLVASDFNNVGSGNVSCGKDGTLCVDMQEKQLRILPKSGNRSAWKWRLADNRRETLLFLGIEGVLFMLAFLTSFLRKDVCSTRTAVVQSMSVALFAAALYTLILPVQSYLVNQSDFKFNIGTLLLHGSGAFCCAFVILVLILFISTRLWGRILHVALVFWLIYEYLETGILSIGQPALNGEIGFFLNRASGVRDAIILLVLVGGGTLFTWKIKNYVHWIALAFLFLSGLSLLDVKVEQKPAQQDLIVSTFQSKVDVAKNTMYSRKRNVMVFVLDMVTSEVAEDVLKADAELCGKFGGFTFYRNNVGMHMCTDVATAGMMTGQYFDDPSKIPDYVYSIFTPLSFVKPYLDASVPMFLLPGSIHFGFSNSSNASSAKVAEDEVVVSNPFQWRMKGQQEWTLYEIVRFRAMPFIVKAAVLKLTMYNWPKRGSITVESQLYPFLAHGKVSDMSDLTLHWYHTTGCHPPLNIDRDGHELAGAQFGYAAHREKTWYSLRLLGNLFDEYRAKGIYDNSLIVICADHGANYENGNAFIKDGMTPKGLPMLWVKPVGTQGKLTFSELPTSHVKIYRLLCDARTKNLSAKDVEKILFTDDRIYRESNGMDLEDWRVDATGKIRKQIVKVKRDSAELKPMTLGKHYSLLTKNREDRPDIICENLDMASALSPRLHAKHKEMSISFRVSNPDHKYAVSLTLQTMLAQTGSCSKDPSNSGFNFISEGIAGSKITFGNRERVDCRISGIKADNKGIVTIHGVRAGCEDDIFFTDIRVDED